MKVKNLIDKLKYLPQNVDVVIVLPKGAIPAKDYPYESVAYRITKIIHSTRGFDIEEVGLSI